MVPASSTTRVPVGSTASVAGLPIATNSVAPVLPQVPSARYTALQIRQGDLSALKANVTINSLFAGCLDSVDYDASKSTLSFIGSFNSSNCGAADLASRIGLYFVPTWKVSVSTSGILSVTVSSPLRRRQQLAPWVLSWNHTSLVPTSTSAVAVGHATTAIVNSSGVATAPTTAANAAATTTATTTAGVIPTQYITITQYVAPANPTNYAAPGAPAANAGNNPFYAAPAAAGAANANYPAPPAGNSLYAPAKAPAGPGNLKASGAESVVAMGAAALVAAFVF
ncbi:hypothetical protein HDU98_004783 [Podochytrium sp. JEL0797]|nr:hypothetical protein HDU98_004783 [Podochytrium sp. JEL0797]